MQENELRSLLKECDAYYLQAVLKDNNVNLLSLTTAVIRLAEIVEEKESEINDLKYRLENHSL